MQPAIAYIPSIPKLDANVHVASSLRRGREVEWLSGCRHSQVSSCRSNAIFTIVPGLLHQIFHRLPHLVGIGSPHSAPRRYAYRIPACFITFQCGQYASHPGVVADAQHNISRDSRGMSKRLMQQQVWYWFHFTNRVLEVDVFGTFARVTPLSTDRLLVVAIIHKCAPTTGVE